MAIEQKYPNLFKLLRIGSVVHCIINPALYFGNLSSPCIPLGLAVLTH